MTPSLHKLPEYVVKPHISTNKHDPKTEKDLEKILSLKDLERSERTRCGQNVESDLICDFSMNDNLENE